MAINKNVLAEKRATVLSDDGNTMYATIQMRHGKESDMDKSKFVPAEMGVATDTKKAFMAFAPGEVKEIMFREDSEIEELLEEVRDISDQAVEAVESAEATAKQAVEDYTEQMKATIPEDYTEMVKKVDMLERTKAPAIYQTVSGESLQIEDSADAPMAGLRVFGKSRQVKTTGAQLFDASKLPTKTQGGATVTNNGDGSFTVTGNGTVSELFVVNYDITGDIAKSFFKAGRVKTALSNVRPYFYFSFRHSGGIYGDVDSKSYTNFDLTDEMINSDGFYVRCGFQLPQGNEIVNGTIKPMVYQDGDGTWEPYTGGKPSPSPDYPQEIEIPGSEGSVGVNVTGAQLFDASNLATKTQGNVTITNNGDGSFNISGNGNVPGNKYPSIMLSKEESLKLIKPGTLRLAENSDVRPRFMAGLRNTQTNTFRKTVGNQLRLSIEITEDDIQKIESGQDVFSYYFFDNADVQIVPGTIKPMVYIGGIPQMPWEPYKHQSITVQTPNGLPGIPVDSGGNYTDADGQQWVSDYIDFERGKYVQCVGVVNNDNWKMTNILSGTLGQRFKTKPSNAKKVSNIKVLCSAYEQQPRRSYREAGDYIATDELVSGNINIRCLNKTFTDASAFIAWAKEINMQTYYILETPVETDLSEEELTAYAALRTNYPTTVVTSDSDPITVGIEVEYVADTQKYIDNKFAELAQNLAATQNTLLEV